MQKAYRFQGNLLALIIALYLNKIFQKSTHENLLIGLGRNGAKNIFLYSYIFNKKNNHFNLKKRISIEIETNSETTYVDESI